MNVCIASPSQDISIRSPMEQKLNESPIRATRASIGKITFAACSPSSSPVKSMKTPSTKSGPDTSVKSSNKKPTPNRSATKKRKLAELEAQETAALETLEKLRKDKRSLSIRISKLAEEQTKYPVKDEILLQLIANTTSKSKKEKAPKELPSAVLQLDTMLPEDSVNDAVAVWDFLNVFSKTLLINTISLDDFVDLMNFTGAGSLALTDIICTLLKLVLSDTTVLAKLNSLLPRKVNYAYRSQQSDLFLSPIHATNEEVDFSAQDLLQQDDFDIAYNGLKLLPRRLRPDTVDMFRWQAVLRCILLRLEPVRQLRRAVVDVAAALHVSYVTSAHYTTDIAANSNDIDNNDIIAEQQELGALVGLASAFKRQRTRAPFKTEAINNSIRENLPQFPKSTSTVSFASNIYSTNEDDATAVASSIAEEEKVLPNLGVHTPPRKTSTLSAANTTTTTLVPRTTSKELSAASIAAINTPKSKSKQQTAGLDRDAVFHISCDVSSALQNVYEAATLLESHEMHELSAKHKLAVLKILCTSCYDTHRIQHLLERNAEERAVQIVNMNKQIREQKLKQKEVSAPKRDAALKACRAINKAAALAKLAEQEKKKLSSSKKKKKGKSDASTSSVVSSGVTTTTADATTANAEINKRKRVAAGTSAKIEAKEVSKESYEPSAEQLSAMIDELVVMDRLGIELVDDSALDALNTIMDDKAASDNNDRQGDDGDDEEEQEEEFDYDNDGNLIIRNNRTRRSRRGTSQTRTIALDRKRNLQEQIQRAKLIEVAHIRLQSALDGEKDLRAAVRYAERAGCKGSNDDGKIFCTSLLKKAYIKLNEVDIKAEEEKAASRYERALQEHFMRTVPLGEDRYRNSYWSFVGDDRLFVQSRILLSEDTLLRTPHPPSSSSSSSGKQDSVLNKLFHSRPNRFQYKWGVYSTPSEQWQLWDALDARGERESELKSAIKARFDIEEPPVVYQTTGSDYIGKKVKRIFGKKKPVFGLIVGWLPATANDVALWHVQHIDGDEEDLEEAEVVECLVRPASIIAALGATTIGNSSSCADINAIDNGDMSSEAAKVEMEAAVDDYNNNVMDLTDDVSQEQNQQQSEEKVANEGNNENIENSVEPIPTIISAVDEVLAAAAVASVPIPFHTNVNSAVNTVSPDSSSNSFNDLSAMDVEEADSMAACTSSTIDKEMQQRDLPRAAAKLVNDGDADGEEEWAETSSTTAGVAVVDDDMGTEYAVTKQTHNKQRQLSLDDVPLIARANRSMYRSGVPSWRAYPLSSSTIGVAGLKIELIRSLNLMSDGLKLFGGGFTRDARRSWEHALRDVDTVAELRTPILELEALVRNLQQAADKHDADELMRAKQTERNEMVKEGWVFDEGAHEYIGRHARRFFKGFGSSDGLIVGYLPPERNEGIVLYHMEHNDGDSEDLDDLDIAKALRSYDEDLKEDDDEEEDDDDDSVEEDEDGNNDGGNKKGKDKEGGDSNSDDGDGSSSDDDDGDIPQYRNNNNSEEGATLWPTYEVRSRWQAALNSCQTVGETALALQCFVDHARLFGVTAETVESTTADAYSSSLQQQQGSRSSSRSGRGMRTTERYTDSSNNNSSSESSRSSRRRPDASSSSSNSTAVRSSRHASSNLSPRKSTKRNHDSYSRDRPRREAARSGKSYAAYFM